MAVYLRGRGQRRPRAFLEPLEKAFDLVLVVERDLGVGMEREQRGPSVRRSPRQDPELAVKKAEAAAGLDRLWATGS